MKGKTDWLNWSVENTIQRNESLISTLNRMKQSGYLCIYGLAVGHLYEVSVNANPTSAIT